MDIEIGKPKPEKPWKWAETEEGIRIPIPSSKQIKPSKYRPDRGKRILNRHDPHCFIEKSKMDNNPCNNLPKCKSCMWRFNCKKE
jgi:3-methyladenine DNA glycosylase AlkC